MKNKIDSEIIMPIIGIVVVFLLLVGATIIKIDDNKKQNHGKPDDGIIANPGDDVIDNNPVLKNYNNGEVVYFNPNTMAKCSINEAVSTTGTKNGCMVWHAFLDNGSDTVNLILDHNTTATVAWNSEDGTGKKEMKEVQQALLMDTLTWHANVKNTARLITVAELAQIAEHSSFVQMEDYGQEAVFGFWLEDPNYEQINSVERLYPAQGQAKYEWLFNYTDQCTMAGCSIEDSATRGYWTSDSAIANNGYANAFVVKNIGDVTNSLVGDSSYYGVRPVITVPKIVLK